MMVLPVFWAAIFAALVVLTQAGSLAQEVTNWDESTFMLLGQDLLDGVLPYTERFDNKPPLIFFMFAGWMALFGESVASARALGDVAMWINALLIYGIARRFAAPYAAGAASALYIVLHAVEPGFHTTAGLPAMSMVMGALWLVLARREKAWGLFAAGMLISLAVLTRTNLAYLALASGVFIFALGVLVPTASRLRWWSAAVYGAGGLLPVLIVVLIYARAGALAELKLSVIDVALSYSGQWGVTEALLDNQRRWVHLVRWNPAIFGVYSVLSIWAMVSVLLAKPGRGNFSAKMDGYDWGFVWVFLLAILWSILKSGAAFNYYWQQFFPITALYIAHLASHLSGFRSLRWAALGLVSVAILAAVARRIDESLPVLTRPGFAQSHYDIRAAADILANRLKPEDRVWALDRHLILVYLDLPPVSRAGAHPSNLTRESVMNTLAAHGYAEQDELGRVMRSLPEFVVSHGDDFQQFYLRPINDEISSWLEENYDLFHETPKTTLYQRKGLARP